jgi:hypothetical protein
VANFTLRALNPREIIAVPIEWGREQFWALLRKEKFVFFRDIILFSQFFEPLLDFPLLHTFHIQNKRQSFRQQTPL